MARIRAWLRLPGGARPGAARPPAEHATHDRAGRVGGGRGPLHGRLSVVVAGWLAPAGPDQPRGLGRHGRDAVAAPSGDPGAIRRGFMIHVVSPGPYATIQDLGRPGYAHLGVPRSGAADMDSLRLANRL